MRLLRVILFPFAVIYDAITAIRNKMYDLGLKPSASFEIPLIGVGNLSVGGTGKTPMIEYLVRLLTNEGYRVATLSRGYKRSTKGVRIAGVNDNASTIGDEPFQFFRKFSREDVVVAVGEDRAESIPFILSEHPDTQIILLDDVFQHRRVRPQLQILLTAYGNLFTRDLVLPAGRLRESRSSASRADVVVITKCPSQISEDEMLSIERSVRKYVQKAVFFASIGYGNIMPAGELAPYRPDKVVLVTGIADPSAIKEYLAATFTLMEHLVFPDHHSYSSKDYELICETALRHKASVVTTEKDAVRMDTSVFQSRNVPLQYLPIEVVILRNGKDFDEMVLNVVRTHAR